MASLLLLNPNTSAEVSALLHREEIARCPPAVTLRVVNARFGPRYITGEIGAAIAGHAALDAYAEAVDEGEEPDAVLLACFGDPGLLALRALSAAPVLGLAEAAMQRAAAHGPFVIVTGGAAWAPILERLAVSLALPAPLLGVQCVQRSGGELAGAADAVPVLAQAAREALARWPKACAVLLGGAGLAGLAEPVAARVPAPVIDNVHAALDAAFALASDAAARAETAQRAWPAAQLALERGPWTGLGATLTHLLTSAGDNARAS